MASAATVVVRLVVAATPERRAGVSASVAFGLATVVAVAIALAFGARALAGIVAVAVVLAGSAAVGAVLNRHARTAVT